MNIEFTANTIETHQIDDWIHGLTLNCDDTEYLHIGREAFRGDKPFVSVWYNNEEQLNENCIKRIVLTGVSVEIILSKRLPGLEGIEIFEIGLNVTENEIYHLKVALQTMVPDLLDEKLVEV
jgi:hypothetical protein